MSEQVEMGDDVERGGRGATALPNGATEECGGRGATALPARKVIDHRGPLSIDLAGAWYFVTICAEGHRPWLMTKGRAVAPRPPHGDDDGRAVAPRPPQFDEIATVILREARENHLRRIWRLALFLVMPDHLHMIVHVPEIGGRGATALPMVAANFKHLLSARYGIGFQRDFFDTRIRDEVHYAEKWNYICKNPVERGLVATPRDWPHCIAFDRTTGEERMHR